MRLAIIALAALTLSSAEFVPIAEPPVVSIEREVKRPALSPYAWAEAITGAPATILQATARTESGERDDAIGDGGVSLGRFQLNETFREWRVSRYGDYDPCDPYSAAVIAGRIYVDNLARLGNPTLAIAAHRQGAGGVERNGPTRWYVERVYSNLRM
ncbi:MAG TPA: hypothetical protein PLW80_11585 [Spirochaetales bacterium]|nr:hypothetical protein [Spirochaetales bacterium]